MKWKIILIMPLLLLGLISANCPADENTVYIISISDPIGPGVAGHIKQGIEEAERMDAACVIIELDTPGGNAESMRDIVRSILASEIPIVVYVFPSGARAASAGVMITMAADIAAMAPGTNIGAAHPVGTGGKDIEGEMSKKVMNDMVASAKSVAEKRGRNVEWVEKAVRESVSVTETEALKENIVDIIARDRADLIKQINGREIKGKGKLNLDHHTTTTYEEGLRTKILKTISDPNIAYILLMLGLAGLYFELSHPGVIFPGVVGGISIVLAFYAMQTLPVNYAGILLIFLGIIFFIMEMKITSYGLLSVAGLVSLFLGSTMLYETESGLKLSLGVFMPTIVIVSAFFITIATLVFKSQVSKPRTGGAGLIDEIGVVRETIDLEGKVLVHGELWKAISKSPIEKGAKVKIVKVTNLLLEVEPIKND